MGEDAGEESPSGLSFRSEMIQKKTRPPFRSIQMYGLIYRKTQLISSARNLPLQK
jgi:hypothetical protein